MEETRRYQLFRSGIRAIYDGVSYTEKQRRFFKTNAQKVLEGAKSYKGDDLNIRYDNLLEVLSAAASRDMRNVGDYNLAPFSHIEEQIILGRFLLEEGDEKGAAIYWDRLKWLFNEKFAEKEKSQKQRLRLTEAAA